MASTPARSGILLRRTPYKERSMPAGRTSSPYPLQQRKRLARDLFLQGYSVTEVADELTISVDTAIRYKQQYEAEIKEQARANPQLLTNVLENTIRAMEELDAIRREAWNKYHSTSHVQTQSNMLNIALKAQSERAKLFGLFGVKPEYMMHVQRVQLLQQKLLEFMARELCQSDRRKLEDYLTGELRAFLQTDVLEIPAAS
jgi:predicted transcriptional regulator